MALPTALGFTLISTGTPHSRPFISSGGNVYVVGRTGTSTLGAKKATDPTSSFSTAGTDVTLANTLQGVTAVQSGDNIHVVTIDGSAATSVNYRYHVFSMSSDSWTTSNEDIHTAINPEVNNVYEALFQVAIRSDGDVILIYNGPRAASMGTNYRRVKYARREGGTWTTNIALDDAGATHWEPYGIVIGASDRMHFFFADQSAGSAYQRSLTSANSLQAFPSAFATGLTASQGTLLKQGASYVSSSVTKVRMPIIGSASTIANSYKFDSADTPSFTSDSDITGTTNVASDNYSLAFTADSTTLWHVFSDSASGDLYTQSNANDGGWDTPASFVAHADTQYRVQTNVYSRGGSTVLAMTYARGSDVYYNEKTLAVGTTNADFDMDATATATFASRSTASSNLNAAAAASLTWVGAGVATVSAAWSAAAAASLTWNGAATASSNLSAAAVASLTWNGAGIQLVAAAFDFDAAAALTWNGAAISSTAWQSAAQAAVTWNGAATSAAALDADAAATVTWNGASLAYSDWSSASLASLTWNSAATASSAWSASAAASVTWVGEASATASGAWQSTALASLTWIGAATSASALSAASQATVTFNGAATSASAWSAAAAAVATFVSDSAASHWYAEATASLALAGAAVAASSWSSSAAATVTWQGVQLAPGAWSSAATATQQWNGEASAAAAWSSAAAASVTWQGVEVGAASQADWQAAAAATLTVTGASVVAASASMTAAADAVFVGADAEVTAVVNLDGWRRKRQMLEELEAIDEEDMMVISAAIYAYMGANNVHN